jgi:TolB-like protein
MDFGLAKVSGATKLTRTGTTMGTVAYMSPEQVQGKEADHRSDIWALGVVLYEMVSGRAPFGGDYEAAMLYSILNEDPAHLAVEGSDIPAGLDGVLAKALAKDPGKRYQKAEELVADLETLARDHEALPAGRAVPAKGLKRLWRRWLPWQRVAAACATAVVMAAVAYGAVVLLSPKVGTIDSIAVLPLVNLLGDAAKESYADGLTGELTACLGSLGSVRIISSQTMRQFKGSDEPMPEIGRRIGAKGLVEGSMSLTGTAIQITVKLFDAARDRMLWQNTYQGEIKNILFIMNEIARTIAKEIGTELTPLQQQRLQSARQVDPEAWKAYLEGVSHAFGIEEEGDRVRSLKMIECFNRAVQIDPEFALAHAALALGYVNLATVGGNPGEAGLEARRAAQRAVELDDALSEAHASLGVVKLNLDWDWSGAESELKRAIELNPSSSDGLRAWKFYLLVVGRGEEAISAGKRLCEIEANSSGILFELGWTCLCARRYDDAIAAFEQVLSRDPKDTYTRSWLADTYALKGICEKFLAECDTLKTLGSDGRPASYALCGIRDKALTRIEELRKEAEREYVEPVYFAMYYAVLGDKDQAFSWLRKGFETRSVAMVRIMKADPYFDSLHSDPRWSELVRLMKFPEGNS